MTSDKSFVYKVTRDLTAFDFMDLERAAMTDEVIDATGDDIWNPVGAALFRTLARDLVKDRLDD